jgi:hypothetical protein
MGLKKLKKHFTLLLSDKKHKADFSFTVFDYFFNKSACIFEVVKSSADFLPHTPKQFFSFLVRKK